MTWQGVKLTWWIGKLKPGEKLAITYRAQITLTEDQKKEGGEYAFTNEVRVDGLHKFVTVYGGNAVGQLYLEKHFDGQIIWNTSKIEEPDQFAEQVIRMCRENGFQTIHFSEDLGGLPSSLFIAVYLKKSDVDKGEPVLRIRYEPLSCAGNGNAESDEEYTIADPPSEYRLTVEDGS